jgi:hypothetical protein
VIGDFRFAIGIDENQRLSQSQLEIGNRQFQKEATDAR